MKSSIILRPTFSLLLSEKIVSILMKESKNHYDSTCRKASDIGGFLYGWSNMVGLELGLGASFRELDLTVKILEMYNGDDIDTVNEYRKLVSKTFDTSNNLNLKSIKVN